MNKYWLFTDVKEHINSMLCLVFTKPLESLSCQDDNLDEYMSKLLTESCSPAASNLVFNKILNYTSTNSSDSLPTELLSSFRDSIKSIPLMLPKDSKLTGFDIYSLKSMHTKLTVGNYGMLILGDVAVCNLRSYLSTIDFEEEPLLVELVEQIILIIESDRNFIKSMLQLGCYQSNIKKSFYKVENI